MRKIKTVIHLLKQTAIAFSEDNALKLSASLSYYTLFSLGPLLLVIISLSGIFLKKEQVQTRLYEELTAVLGPEAGMQVQSIITNAAATPATTAGAIVGTIILFIGATGVFTEMQSSINFIWSVKAKPRRSWLQYIINRLISFSLVVGLGFLLLVSLLVNALLALMNNYLAQRIDGYNAELVNLGNGVVLLAVISLLFTVIYKVLPDAIISWKDAWIGSLFTAGLFLVGKFLIGLYLGQSKLGITYGTAASIIIILVWVYYSAVILYFGAEFTKIYALHSGEGIKPKQTAVFIIKKEAKEIPSSRLD